MEQDTGSRSQHESQYDFYGHEGIGQESYNIHIRDYAG